MRTSHIIILVAALTPCGCGKSSTGSNSTTDKVTYVAGDDARMNAAIDKARATVDTFVAALGTPQPGQSAFSVKMPFSDGKTVEHMWLANVRHDGTKFHGTVNNDPQDVSHVKIGDQASVEPAKISDWMYVENGKLIGGYTLRVLRDGLSPDERAAFDKSVPFSIE